MSGGSSKCILPRVSFALLGYCFAEVEDEGAWDFALERYIAYLEVEHPDLVDKFKEAKVVVTDLAPGSARSSKKYVSMWL